MAFIKTGDAIPITECFDEDGEKLPYADQVFVEEDFQAKTDFLWKINGKRVTETFEANHGFTVGFLPVRRDKPFHFTDLNEIFKLIRKYCN